MHFVVYNVDRPGTGELRAKTRPDHLAFIKSLGDSIKAGGPLLDADGTPIGGMFVLEAESLDAATETAFQDPYVVAGLFESTSVRAWRWQTNPPESA